jgi:hypothetical protein
VGVSGGTLRHSAHAYLLSLHDDEETSTSYKGKNHLILHLLMTRQALLTREKKHLILHLLVFVKHLNP